MLVIPAKAGIYLQTILNFRLLILNVKEDAFRHKMFIERMMQGLHGVPLGTNQKLFLSPTQQNQINSTFS